MDWTVILLGVALLFAWVERRYHETRLKITGCSHEKVKTMQMRHEFGDTLYLKCLDCQYQIHVPRVMPLPDGTYWFLDENEDEMPYTQRYMDILGQQGGKVL